MCSDKSVIIIDIFRVLKECYINRRYDIALGINTLGVLNVLNFAKRCAKINIFVQVSTGIYKNKTLVSVTVK